MTELSIVENQISAKLHGTSLNKVQNLYGAIKEAASRVMRRVGVRDTIRKAPLANIIYDDVYRYPLPSDVYGDRIIAIKDYRSDTKDYRTEKRTIYDFNRDRAHKTFYVEHDSGNRFLKMSQDVGSKLLFHNMDSVNANGNWVGTDDTIGITTDSVYKYSGQHSIRFNVDGDGTVAGIENSTLQSVDLTDYKDVSACFIPVYIPSGATVTDFTYTWGTDASNRYSATVTTQSHGAAFEPGAWNILRFNWNGQTPTGTPTDSNIGYTKLSFTYDGEPRNGFRVDNIIFRKGELFEITYFSKFAFTDSEGNWIATPTQSTDFCVFDAEAIDLLVYEVMEIIAQQVQGEDSSFDFSYFTQQKTSAYLLYGGEYKSMFNNAISTYYKMPRV